MTSLIVAGFVLLAIALRTNVATLLPTPIPSPTSFNTALPSTSLPAATSLPSVAQQQTWAAQAQTAYPISPTQYAYWTQTATAGVLPTPAPPPGFLPPSGDWMRFTHPIYNYSFEHPSNWRIDPDTSNDAIYVINANGPAKDSSGVTPLKLAFFPPVNISPSASLEDFLAKQPVELPSELLSQEAYQLPNGNQVVQRKVKHVMSYDGVLYTWIASGERAYMFYASDLRSRYINVAEHVVESFIIP